MEMHEIKWACTKDHIPGMLKNICEEYKNNDKFKVNFIYEDNELKGFCVYHDEKDYRMFDEAYYIGKDMYAALKMWKWAIKGAKKIRIIVQKWNERILKKYKRMGFNIIASDTNNYLLER